MSMMMSAGMSVKRKSVDYADCTYGGAATANLDHHGSGGRGALKRMKSIETRRGIKTQQSVSDEIGPLLTGFCHVQQQGVQRPAVQRCISITSIEERSAGHDEGEEAGVKRPSQREIPQSQVASWGVHGAEGVTEVDGRRHHFKLTDLTAFASQTVTTVAGKLHDVVHHGFHTEAAGVKQPVPPGNNVYLPHPILGLKQVISMGMHIEPVNDPFISGHKVLRIEEGKIAEKVKLRENDVLVAIGDTCIRKLSLPEVLTLFGTLKNTFSITILREDAEGNTKFLIVTITVQITITDGDIISITIIDIKAARYYYQHTYEKMVISQKISDTHPTRFLTINEDKGCVTMETLDTSCVPEQSQFRLNIYHGATEGPATVVTLCNNTNSKALDARSEDQYQIILSNADDLTQKDDTVTSDNRFFYYHSTGAQYEQAFESIEKKDHYLTYEDGTLKLTLQQVGKEMHHLPSSCRFTVFKEDQQECRLNAKQKTVKKPSQIKK